MKRALVDVLDRLRVLMMNGEQERNMYTFKINVALAGSHYLRIELPQGTSETKAMEKFRVVSDAFKAQDPDFDVLMTRWENSGVTVADSREA